MVYDVIVIGAGPAGVMCSLEASKNGKVLLIESNEKILQKLAASGGGRCNITNDCNQEEFFKSIGSEKFLKSTLSNFDNKSVIELLDQNRVEWKVEGNKIFPTSNKSSTIVEMFTNLLKKSNVDIFLKEKVTDIKKVGELFYVKTKLENFAGAKVVIATGGSTYEALGSTEFAFRIAKQFEIELSELHPTNTALKLNISDKLMGISISDATVKSDLGSSCGDILFTHFGITGPAIFRLTAQKQLPKTVSVCVTKMTEAEFKSIASTSNKSLINTFKNIAPERYLRFVMANDAELKANETKKDALERVYKNLTEKEFVVKSAFDFDKAFTTGGGIKLNELSPRTFETKKVKGLHFIGECIDYYAPTGGFNITLCLSMGYTCGKNI